MCIADLFPKTLQNIPVVMLVNCLVWKNKLLMCDALTCLPGFFLMCRGQSLLLRGLLFSFWIIIINPGFISCSDLCEEVLVISDFIQQFLVHKHILLLLLVCQHLRHKLHRDLPHTKVVSYNLLVCSIQEVQPASDV
jgi:hypothetical protein